MLQGIQTWLPSLREPKILHEQLSLIHSNYLLTVIAYWLICLLGSMIVFYFSADIQIILWLCATSTITVYAAIHHFNVKDDFDAKKEARHQIAILFIMGLLFGSLPILFLEPDSPPILAAYMVMLCSGVAAGALVMQAPCLPIFVAFLLTDIPGLLIAFTFMEGIYYGIVFASALFTIVLYYCAFNMEQTVKKSIELRFANSGLIDKLQLAVNEAETANHDRSVFLASASHDLSQPLHAMGLFIETFKNLNLNHEQQQVINRINSANKSTHDTLNTLLNFSKLDAGIIEPNRSIVDIQQLFSKLEQEINPCIDNENLSCRYKKTHATAYTDSALLEVILRNLISNAIRYTLDGSILVACRKRSKHLSIEVWDSGIGIPQYEQDNIFKAFYKLDQIKSDRKKGFGLGLAIVKGLCDSLDIQLEVKSRPGYGSLFRLLLPISQTEIINTQDNQTPNFDFSGLSIVFIDDDSSIRTAMKTLINSWGSHCMVAGSLFDGQQMLDKNSITPDILIVDYSLRENQTGGEAIVAIRRQLANKVPAIIVTGDSAAERLQQAQKYDATLLHKPVIVSELQQAIQELLSSDQRPMKNLINTPQQ